MAHVTLFDRAIALLFGKEGAGDQDRELVASITEAIVDTVAPKLRAHRRYRQELEGGVRTTIAHLRGLASEPLDTVLLDPAYWGSEPRLNAFFANSADLTTFLGRSKELRAFFDADAGAAEAFALLAMKREEKTVFGPRMEGGILKEDVAQTAVNFTRHRIVAPAATEHEARLEVGRRIMLRLAQVALGRILAIERKGVVHAQKMSHLASRLRYLKLGQDGMEGIVEDPETLARLIDEVQGELDRAANEPVEAASSTVTLDGYLEQIKEVFSHPQEHVVLSRKELRLSRMNLKVGPQSEEPAHDLTLAELRVGDRVDAVVAFVHCPRSALPAPEDRLAQAERFL